ncbi:putative lipase ROG1 isoform X1 [Solanum lycopersicum]|uniref:putative lipase ROG1 isoform X1 n=1 Tax=Solanum lycopersicum TaxID=4081 RepID=UPI000532E36D|nr:putative lipase ROG1 isoform X1 [Solanum lycopersicum]
MITKIKQPFKPKIPISITTSVPQLSGSVLSFFSKSKSRFDNKGVNNCRLLWVDEKGEMELLRKLSRGCFRNSLKKGQKVKIESVNDGEDVFDAASARAKLQPEHLVVMVNGLVGSSADWRYAAEQFVKRLPEKIVVHCSECNYSMLTFDGVDRMGERLAKEVEDVIKRWPGVRKISFVAHSLGGLVARYAIGRLYEPPVQTEVAGLNRSCLVREENVSDQCHKQSSEETVAGLEPVNFITVATPHLGSRGHKQLPLLCGLPLLEKGALQTAHWIAGRSGKHLFLTDKDNGKPPLLLRMVNDSDDLMFMSGLRSFKRRVAYANANYDHVVGWRTSSIRRQDELPKSNLQIKDQKYPHIVNVEQETTLDINHKLSSLEGKKMADLEAHVEEMIEGLTQVPWERIDVSFHESRQRYVAHNTIQVKTYWLNSDGADVIEHMIDNFLL